MSDEPQVVFKSDDKQKIKRMMNDYTNLVSTGNDKAAQNLLHNIQSDIKNMTPSKR
jgi:hypothetical protein